MMPRWTVLSPRDSADAISDGPQRLLGWGLDAVAAEDWTLLRGIFEKHRGLITSLARQIDLTDPAGGSGNFFLNAVSLWALAEPHNPEPWRLIGKWCSMQLGRIDGPFRHLGWTEPMSPQYTDGVLAGLALVARRFPREAKAAGLFDLLEAWGDLFSLFTVPVGQYGLTVVAPGARATPGNDGNDELSYLMEVWIHAEKPYDHDLTPERGWGEWGQPAWSLRALWAAGSPLESSTRTTLAHVIKDGDRVGLVVERLRNLGVTLRVPFHAERFPNGELASWMGYPDRQSHVGATGARYAASYVDGKFYWLTLHPKPYNFASGRKVGTVKVFRGAAHIFAEAIGASGFKEAPPSDVELREDGYHGKIPIPIPVTGFPLYHVTIGPDGVTLGGAMPDDQKPPRDDEDDEPGDVEEKIQRHLGAIWKLIDSAAGGSVGFAASYARAEKRALAVARLRGWTRP